MLAIRAVILVVLRWVNAEGSLWLLYLPEGVVEGLPSHCKDAQAANPYQGQREVQQ